jgi:hypothetical protein
MATLTKSLDVVRVRTLLSRFLLALTDIAPGIQMSDR